MSTPEQDPFRVVDDDPDEQPASPPAPPVPPKPDLDEEGGNGFHVVPLEEVAPAQAPDPAPAPEPTPRVEDANGDGFRVEPLTEIPRETPPPPAPPRQRPATRRPVRAPDEETGVDTRTVAERRGDAVGVVAGRRPPPEDWPGEAFRFPLRSPGPQMIAGAAVLLTVLDVASRANFFLGLMLKLIAAFLFLRWQLHVASRTAAGHDAPAGWAGAMDMSGEKIRAVGVLLGAAFVFAGPGIVADLLERPGLAIVLFLVGSVLLAAGALGQVVGDVTLIRPWNALAWIARHPLGLLASTAGWWAAGWTEIIVWWMRDTSIGLFLAASLGLRLVGTYLWLFSARVLGVVGRSWSLFDDDEPLDDDAPTSRG